jgi:hypothetical protein
MKSSAVSLVRWGFVAAVLLAGPVAAAQQHTPLTDQQIQSQVEHRLSEKPVASVTVAVRNRVVTLTGIVASVWAKNEAIEQARGIHDVESVVSEITIARGESDQATADEIAKRVRHARQLRCCECCCEGIAVEANGGQAQKPRGEGGRPPSAKRIVSD